MHHESRLQENQIIWVRSFSKEVLIEHITEGENKLPR